MILCNECKFFHTASCPSKGIRQMVGCTSGVRSGFQVYTAPTINFDDHRVLFFGSVDKYVAHIVQQ